MDLVENSVDTDGISYSDEVFKALEFYKEFNYENIYRHPLILMEMEKIRGMYNLVYNQCLEDLETNDDKSKIFSYFINYKWMNSEYMKNSLDAEKARDYISGMTDQYFEKIFKDLVLPTKHQLLIK